MKLTEHQKDILLAGAIGDAVGYRIEFDNINKIKNTYGKNGLTFDHIKDDEALVVSDDTQMTLFALEALHYGPESKNYQTAFQAWYLTQENELYGENHINDSPLFSFKSLHALRAPGNTCLSSLSSGVPVSLSKGCGGIMRVVPLSFLPTLEEAINHGAKQASLTHGHPSGYWSAGFFAGLIHIILNNPTLTYEEAIDKCIKTMEFFDSVDETLDAVEKARTVYRTSSDSILMNVHKLGGGWTGEEALAIAIYCVFASTTFEEAVEFAINHDGDSDSTGTLTAQLWVALYGLPEKYKSWADRLDVADAFKFVLDEKNYLTGE
jgi:ADP-ribosylglycohydrolase